MTVDFGAEMAKPRSSAHSQWADKYLSHLINVGVGTGNSEVISIGVEEKLVGLGECIHSPIYIPPYRGYTFTLRDPYPDRKIGEKVKLYRKLLIRPFK